MPYAGESTELISQLRCDLARRDDQIKSLHAIVELREEQLTQCKAELVTQLNKAIKEIEDYNDVYKNRCFELSNVLQELANAKKDGERLDLLEQLFASSKSSSWLWDTHKFVLGRSLRQAIDDAMQSEQRGEA